MKSLRVALLFFSVFTPTAFAQTVEQKEFSGCIEIISGTQRRLQGENATPAVEQTAGTERAKRLTPEQRKGGATRASKPATKALPVPGMPIRDFEDNPEGPIISVAR